jgi:hypothetical protein
MERQKLGLQTKTEEQWLGVYQEVSLPPVWPFSIRWQDEKRADKWLSEGFSGKDLIILGPPQAVISGVRILTPIVEMAKTMEIIRENNLGMPNPGIFCPIYINAEVNHIAIEENELMAENYTELAEKYFAVFHPNLPQPRLITDSQPGAQLLRTTASQVKNYLSPQTLEMLLNMAGKHSKSDNQELLVESTTAYLLAHYVVYDYLPLPEYCNLKQQTLMLVPQSEQKFHDLMNAEIHNIVSVLPEVSLPTDDETGSMIIGYSHALKTAHYYPHQGERSLAQCRNVWPTRNQLSRQAGLNGRAKDEIWEAVQLIEADISQNMARAEGIRILQNRVLKF